MILVQPASLVTLLRPLTRTFTMIISVLMAWNNGIGSEFGGKQLDEIELSFSRGRFHEGIFAMKSTQIIQQFSSDTIRRLNMQLQLSQRVIALKKTIAYRCFLMSKLAKYQFHETEVGLTCRIGYGRGDWTINLWSKIPMSLLLSLLQPCLLFSFQLLKVFLWNMVNASFGDFEKSEYQSNLPRVWVLTQIPLPPKVWDQAGNPLGRFEFSTVTTI